MSTDREKEFFAKMKAEKAAKAAAEAEAEKQRLAEMEPEERAEYLKQKVRM